MYVSRGAARAMGHRPVGTAGSRLKGLPGRISAQISDSDGGSSGGMAGSYGHGPRGVRSSSSWTVMGGGVPIYPQSPSLQHLYK